MAHTLGVSSIFVASVPVGGDVSVQGLAGNVIAVPRTRGFNVDDGGSRGLQGGNRRRRRRRVRKAPLRAPSLKRLEDGKTGTQVDAAHGGAERELERRRSAAAGIVDDLEGVGEALYLRVATESGF